MTSRARLGIDVGTVRIGVAVCPGNTQLAMPVETVSRGDGDLARIAAIALERGAEIIFVGDPITLAGKVEQAAKAARQFASELADHVPELEVRMVDERLTTAESARSLAAAGRDTRNARKVIDQAAAVSILQNAVDTEAITGERAGTKVQQERDE